MTTIMSGEDFKSLQGRDFIDLESGPSRRYQTSSSVRWFFGNDSDGQVFTSTNMDVEEFQFEVSATDTLPGEQQSRNGMQGCKDYANDLNKGIYQGVFLAVSLLLNFTWGILAAIFWGITFAVTEFFMKYIALPGLRVWKMLLHIPYTWSVLVAEIWRPVMSLFCPWNKN